MRQPFEPLTCYIYTMFVHSLWSLASLSFWDAQAAVSEFLGDFEPYQIGPGSIMRTRTERTAGVGGGDDWIRPGEENWVDHLAAVYVLDVGQAGFPSLPGGTVMGAVSNLPALNADIMDQFVSRMQARIIEPDLRRDTLANLHVYEARIVTDAGERSITYADPDSASSRFADDWAGDAPLTAATLWHEHNGLLTAFADGQIWLEGVGPSEVPDVVAQTVGRLWTGGMAAL